MEKQTGLAFVLIILLTLAWMVYVQKTRRPPAQREQPARPSPIEPRPAPPPPTQGEPAAAAKPATAGKPAEIQELPEGPVREFTIAWSDLLHTTHWISRGACLLRVTFADFYTDVERQEPLTILHETNDGLATLQVRDPDGLLPLDSRVFSVTEQEDGRVSMSATFSNGLKLTKTLHFVPGKYHLLVDITLENTGAVAIAQKYEVLAAAEVLYELDKGRWLKGVIGQEERDGETNVEDVPAKSVRKEPFHRVNTPDNPVLWAGVVNKYFAVILQPLPTARGRAEWVRRAVVRHVPRSQPIKRQDGTIQGYADNVIALLQTDPVKLRPGEQVTHAYLLYIGPKDKEVLADYPAMTGLIYYGWFGSISRLLLGLLNLFHRLIPNYGVGIILLTMVVRLALHPLTRRSQISMQKMQKLQPEIKKLREKYKDDKQRAAKEQMELFKKHGANPMSGCLPIFLQLPVFIGLFRALQWSIDLRQQSFVFWIGDLSRPDTIAHLGNFPLNILPILMVTTWVVQQRMMPKSEDPQARQQQKMMMLMPIFFGFMLYPMASGLTLYWTTSTLLGIIEQKLIKRQIKRLETDRGLPGTAEPTPEKPQKPSWKDQLPKGTTVRRRDRKRRETR